ncbi:MAG: amidohydrolase family protein [Eubacteriaceae bacterium]|nr:amidohydrolase family protein [Eubacteriaceae bacterium]
MKRAYINGIVLDGSENMCPQYGKAILADEGIISDIIDDKNVPSDYEKVDLLGSYIMPGLINMHVHLAGSGKPRKKQSDPVKLVRLITSNSLTRSFGKHLVAGFAKMQLMSGVTTIRTVGGIADFDTSVRDEINAGKRIGPRILASNMAISVPGGHMAGSLAYEAETPDDAVKYVDIIAKDKPDIIKLMITGGVLDAEKVGEPGVLRMKPEIVRAACDRAHRLGYKVAAHVESPEGVKVALENGVDSIEHGAKPSDDIIKLFKDKKAFHVSTLSPALPFAVFDRNVSHATYEQQENGKIVFDGIVSMAKDCLKNGIPVGLGTDTACPYVTQYDMWRELYYYVKYCGVSESFAIYSATLLNATLAGIDDITGSIEKGKLAEMIVVKSNPLNDLKALRNVQMVVMQDKIYELPKTKKIQQVEIELDKQL